MKKSIFGVYNSFPKDSTRVIFVLKVSSDETSWHDAELQQTERFRVQTALALIVLDNKPDVKEGGPSQHCRFPIEDQRLS